MLIELFSITLLVLLFNILATQPLKLWNSILCGVGITGFLCFIVIVAITFYNHVNDCINELQNNINDLEGTCNDMNLLALEDKARIKSLSNDKREIIAQFHNYKIGAEEGMENAKQLYLELEQKYAEARDIIAKNGL